MKLPPVGLRILKTTAAVYLCFLIGFFRGDGVPFYSAIAAILCMQQDVPNSLKVALNRTVGTLIGGAYGMLLLVLLRGLRLFDHPIVQYSVISLSLIPLIYITVLVKKTAATYITCVVFLSVTVSHGTDLLPYLFALNRILDTLVGIFVSLGINWLPFLRNRAGNAT